MKSWLEKNGIEMSSEEVFVIKNAKNAVSWTYVSSDLKGEEIVGTSYKNELQKTNQKEFRIEKLIKRKGDKLYVKWKPYDNSLIAGLIKKKQYNRGNIFQNQNL